MYSKKQNKFFFSHFISIYQDVPRALRRWTNELNIKIYIYSSGSVEAQRLLFGHTEEGNLLSVGDDLCYINIFFFEFEIQTLNCF